MSVDPTTFSTITPSQYISFTLPTPLQNHHHHLNSPLLRVAVLDSPTQPTTAFPPQTAAMIVPLHRESDWIFSTISGHLQLLLASPDTSRLVLIGNNPTVTSSRREKELNFNLRYNAPGTTTTSSVQHTSPDYPDLEELLMPLVISLCPKLGFDDVCKFREIPFLSYYDGVVSSVVVEMCTGASVGEMLVEDVEICDEFDCKKVEFRRRLRFKRTPNLIQTQMRISPNSKPCENESLSSFLNTAVLVQPYLVPMVASISLVGLSLDEKVRSGLKPKALCLGVGGGALLSFLNTRLEFEVVGVEEDEAVIGLAKRRFALPDNPYIRVCIGDGIELIKKFAREETGYCLGNREFDVVMVDLDSSEVGIGTMAPPLEFIDENVLVATRAVLSEGGIVVVNVIPTSSLLHERLVGDFRQVFYEVYEIDVGNGENFVLIGSRNPIGICSRDIPRASVIISILKTIQNPYERRPKPTSDPPVLMSERPLEEAKTKDEQPPKKPVQPLRLPTAEEIRGQDIWNNCAVRSVMSGVMGGGLGIFMGMFLGAFEAPLMQETMSTKQQIIFSAKQMGRKSWSSCKAFAVMGFIFSAAECVVEKHRAKHDITNTVVAGCATGGAISARGGPKAACFGCAGFATFSVVIEKFLESRD